MTGNRIDSIFVKQVQCKGRRQLKPMPAQKCGVILFLN
jgi:hypothetical protein